MDQLLTPVSTTYLKPQPKSEALLTEVKSTNPSPHQVQQNKHISSADEALDTLKSQPDYETLIQVLRFVTDAHNFNLQAPGPKSASIIHLLVTEIAPNYWTLLEEGSLDEEDDGQSKKGSPDAELFVQCLRSVTGINAIITQIKALLQESRLGGKEAKRTDVALNLNILLSLLAAVLQGDDTIRTLWVSSTSNLPHSVLARGQSQKLVSVLTNGQVVSISAEAMAVIGRDGIRPDSEWIADGKALSQWIGRNIVTWAKLGPQGDELKFCSDLFQRCLSLGYSDSAVRLVVDGLLLSKGVDSSLFTSIVFHQPQAAKKTLHILLHYLSERYLNNIDLTSAEPHPVVSAAAGAIDVAVGNDETRRRHLVDWCTSASGAGLGDGVAIRRAVLAVLAQDKETITTVLEKSLSQFGDELYIRHTAILQQDVHAQILLLSAGYVQTLSPIKLTILLRTGSYLSTISNRISATQIRARFLGMVVGESLSALVDNKDKKLDFHMEETDTEEAQWLKDLTKVADPIGPIEPILLSSVELPTKHVPKQRTPAKKPQSSLRKMKAKPATAVAEKPKAIIEEIGSDEEDDDLVPYSKHSDPEDSDDDATLVQRNKIKPPVYIRDLITFLRDSENYDKQKLALQTAPVLIRRKANYGTEVSSHADELAGLLVGLQDKFEIDDFGDLRLQGMVSLVVSQPKSMAPWFARTFFEGDYSLSQRTSVLITLGLSARELAGFETSQYQAAAAFPSKQLPEKMEQLYLAATTASSDDSGLPSSKNLKALPPSALDNITQSITSSFLAPLAADAADATTGPEVLKLQSFTARYKSANRSKPRLRAIPNTTASLLATSFFLPLTAHFQVALRSSRPLILNPALLSLYLQTIGIIIHAAGPSTLSLPQLTSELWDLLLGVRVHTMEDLGAKKGWMFAMASLLEVNGDNMRKLCETQGREVVETREWVGTVFHQTRGEDGGEENEVKMLAAGVLIKLGEAVEKYQALLMGDLIGFT